MLSQEVNGETVILDLLSGQYFGLDEKERLETDIKHPQAEMVNDYS